MTLRQAGELGIKLLGVYFAASAVHWTFGVLSLFVLPQVEGLPAPGDLAAANSLTALGNLIVAAVCLFRGGSIARRLFADEPLAISGPSRRDLLVAGVALLGLSMALAGVPGLVQIVIVVISYAEASRQPMFWTAMGRWTDTLVNSGLALLVGGVTVAWAARIASALDGRDGDLPPRAARSDEQP